jgi:acetyl/propionyl-CoA carboxylase alpha subunit/acetyl-CoA carboxylase carboxyltransferase component
MTQSFERVAIVNRGESAMRLIHAVREFNRENDTRLRTIAIYTEPESRAMFVREADEAYLLGPAYVVDEAGERKNAYVDYVGLERVLVESRAEAVWVGWGFVSEHPDFADLCARLGIVFIGPDGDCMRKLGDKIESKRIAENAGVPVAPWSNGPVPDVAAAREQAEKIGYPLMIKATAGGGGRGIRAVHGPEELAEAFERASSEARSGFGNATVFMERLVEGARHIEVQVIADSHGNAWAVGVRDCSVQRRNQKLIEESSSPVLSEQQERDIRAAAARLCREAGYRNAGTVEFLYKPESKLFSFMEVNARLQVEHPVTEVTTDLDLVKLQLAVARGKKLEGEPPAIWGRAIEVRLNAEDPDNDFAPAPGRVELLKLPTGAGIRIDTGIEEGDLIPSQFDSMIAKVIAHGRTRNEALARLRRALTELKVVVRGGNTNRAFLLELLGRQEVVDGSADVGWLDRSPPSTWPDQRPFGQLALIVAAIEAYETEFEAERQVFLATAARGRPKLRAEIGRPVELRTDGNLYRLNVMRLAGRRYAIEVDGQSLSVNAEPLGEFERRLTCAGRIHRTVSVADGVNYLVEIDGVPHRISRDDSGIVRSPTPAVVVNIAVAPGDEVERGDTLAILEAMKLEMRVTAPFPGTVSVIEASANEQVDAGAPLFRLKPQAESGVALDRDRLDFGEFVTTGDKTPIGERCRQIIGRLHDLMLGYDVEPTSADAVLKTHGSLCEQLPPDDAWMLASEDRLLTQFADICALSRRQPEAEPDYPEVIRRSPQESLFTYLRALDACGEGLSPQFVGELKQALAHYDIHDLMPSPALEEALLWIHKSHSRVQHQIPAVISVLEQRLKHIEQLRPLTGEEFRTLLERIVAVSRNRYPAVSDLAHELRYEYFDKPLFDESRNAAYDDALAQLDHLAQHPDAPDTEERIDALLRCPQPLMGILSDRFVGAAPAMRELLLDCQTRRYYRLRELERIRHVTLEGHPFVTAEYDHQGSRIQLITTHTELSNLARAGDLVASIIADLPPGHDVVVDFYIRGNNGGAGAEDQLASVSELINAMPLPGLRRIVASVSAPDGGRAVSAQHYFTFRYRDGGYVEERVYRGLHPMMAKRLHLWRLSNFALTRLHTVEDAYLFHAVAHENARDERLFAVAEVRDATPVRDDQGRIIALPHLEHMLAETLASIRLVQSHRPTRKRLQWNRVLLYVWPPLSLEVDELQAIVEKLAPDTEGLGIEKVVVQARVPVNERGDLQERVLHIWTDNGGRPIIQMTRVTSRPIKPLSPYRQTVVKMRQRGLHYPYEVVRMLAPAKSDGRSAFPPGSFQEHDLGNDDGLVPVERPHGQNNANVVVGLITNYTDRYPEGMQRVIILGDPSRALGSLAEPECRRIIAALNLAEQKHLPVEWFAVSAGAKISMDSGTENMDWIARVLRRIVGFTQAGGEINLIVAGINVGAQPYWNAEATMLMHTRGILVMTPEGAMVLTGKQALDYAGSVSAEDNFGIGGYDRIMGANGQAQYWARDLAGACRILLQHYAHTYVAPGERFPRLAATTDAPDRDVCASPYRSDTAGDFRTVGEVFSDDTNPGRKRPFDVRNVMHAVIDQDHDPLERWSAMQDGEIGVVWDAHLAGRPVCLVGMESRPLTRAGLVPADGPDHWTAGTLFPNAAKKIARAINAASGNRPLVVLANLSGFDGSPESMRRWQLEYGAEIGRAVVNFDGPIVFCVISRYHGGAFVVFSRWLNDRMEVAALDGTFASVIGGAPAAAVVFTREVKGRTASDPRVQAAQRALDDAPPGERARLRVALDEVTRVVHGEKLGEVADEFESIHSVERAREVGSVDRIIAPSSLRPYLVEAVERGVARMTTEREHG